MNLKSNKLGTAVHERRTVSDNPQRRASFGSSAKQASLEDIPLTQLSHERVDSLQNAHALHSSGLAARRMIPALVTSAQGCLAIGLILTFASTGSWSLQHQWLGYAVLMISIALCGALRLCYYLEIKSSTIRMERGAIHAERDVSHRILRIMGIVLIIVLGFTIISGWMYTLDFFWGLIWIEDVHSILAYAALALLVFYGALAMFLKLRNGLF